MPSKKTDWKETTETRCIQASFSFIPRNKPLSANKIFDVLEANNDLTTSLIQLLISSFADPNAFYVGRKNHAPVVRDFAYILRGIKHYLRYNVQWLSIGRIIDILSDNINNMSRLSYDIRPHTNRNQYRELLNTYQTRFLLVLYVCILAKENGIDCSVEMHNKMRNLCICVRKIRQNNMRLRKKTDSGHLRYYNDIRRFEQHMTYQNSRCFNYDSLTIVNMYYRYTIRVYEYSPRRNTNAVS